MIFSAIPSQKRRNHSTGRSKSTFSITIPVMPSSSATFSPSANNTPTATSSSVASSSPVPVLK